MYSNARRITAAKQARAKIADDSRQIALDYRAICLSKAPPHQAVIDKFNYYIRAMAARITGWAASGAHPKFLDRYRYLKSAMYAYRDAYKAANGL
jgi:hypothetical protein